MWQLDTGTIITLFTIMFAVGGIVLGSVVPALMEGRLFKKSWKA